jgi:hypothetical protein
LRDLIAIAQTLYRVRVDAKVECGNQVPIHVGAKLVRNQLRDRLPGALNEAGEHLIFVANGDSLSIVVRRDALHKSGRLAIKLALLSGARTVSDARPRQLVLDDSS